ncbi:unnamed protein product [Phytophthora fragariaefolia]|uniref:Unnamed protein product n=1 Tax=Phytophthora fragariaefolia TaxID=1490495 RepID=A0A9W6XSM4_9STRA|nr:unnamed protein product [Phytophthora fragariaefolia]
MKTTKPFRQVNSNEESQTLPTIPNAEDIDPVAVQKERRRQIAKAQEEELKWANLKAVLRGNSAKLGYKAARDAWKVMDQFVLSEVEVPYYEGTSRRKKNDELAEIALRLVVPTTMIQEVLQNCHDSLEGGHQGDSEEEREVQVDYEESPDEAPGSPIRSTSGTAAPPTRDASPRVLRTPNPFPERPAGLLALRELSEPRDPTPGTVVSAVEESVVTNDLDEAQSLQVVLKLQAPVSRRPVARPLLTPSVRDYGFQPRDPAETARHAASPLLNTYVIGAAARTPEELAQRAALRERFVTPEVIALSGYRERLRVQGQRGSVPPMRTYPVVLQPGEDSTEYDSRFEL